MGRKSISPISLKKYIKDMIHKECNLFLSDRDLDKIFDSIEYSVKELIVSGYSFKLFGIRYDVEQMPPVVYKDVRDGNIRLSKSYSKLKVKPCVNLRKELKDRTKYDSIRKPKLLGLKKEELPKNILERLEI